MANILGTLAGAGQGLSNWAQNYQRAGIDQDMAKLNDELLLARAKSLEQFKGELEQQGRGRMTQAIDTKAKGIIDARMAGNQVADPSTWTPEQEAARSAGLATMAQDPRTRAQAAAQAGYTDEAFKLDKIAESGASNVGWGNTRIDAEGNVIYDNASALKGSLAQQAADAATARADAAKAAAEGRTAGKGTKADNFDLKQWDAAYKPDKVVVSLPTPMGDKDVESASLRGAYKTAFNQARSTGNFSPNEANEEATTTVLQLRERALAMSQASKGKLSPEQAAGQILSQYNAAVKKSEASPAADARLPGATGDYRTEGNLNTNTVTGMGADPKAIDRELTQARADLKRAPDGQGKADLQAYINDLERQKSNLGGAASKPEPVAAKPKDEPKPKPEALEWEQLRDQAKALDSKISEARRDYNLATSVRGGRGVSDETKAKIKTALDNLIAQQRDLYSKSESAYRAADRAIINSRVSPGNNLNTKYQ